MSTYTNLAATSLPSAVGVNCPDGCRRSDGQSGHVAFGPHITLHPGSYVAGFRLRKLPGCGDGIISVDVYSPQTETLVYRKVPTNDLFEGTTSLIPLEFKLTETTESVEVRMFIEQGILIELKEMVVFARDLRNWGGQ